MENNLHHRPSEVQRKRHHRRKRRFTAALGSVILVFALIGVVICVYSLFSFGFRTAKNYATPKEDAKYFENYLSLVAGLDPAPYPDLKSANADWMLKTAIWAAVWQDNQLKAYVTRDDGRKVVPTSDIAKNFSKYFGDTVKPAYHTFTDNGITFEFDSKSGDFYVPASSVTYVFAPRVTNISRKGDNVTLTVQYLPSSGWTKKSDNSLVPPSPSKTMTYYLKGGNGVYMVNSIKAVTSTSSAPSSSAASGQS